jgi:hypothetical protein
MFMKILRKKSFQKIIYPLFLLACATVIIGLAVYNQPYYPRTWQDEGFALQGAMNLARYGQYAMKSAEGFRAFDQPLIANGPGVVVPIFVAYKLFGIGLIQARFVMVIFFVVTCLFFFSLAMRLYGKVAAFISLFLLLALPEEGFVLYGRHALGMIPSLLYFLIGYLFWLKAFENKYLIPSIGAGLFFGLAMVTKGQYLLVIPMLLLVMILDWIYYQQGLFKRILIVSVSIVVILSIWYGLQYIILGPQGFAQSVNAIQSSSKMTITAFRMVRIPGNLWYLVRSGILLVILPGWVYVGIQSLRRESKSIKQLLLLIFVPVWLSWFAFVSVGFHRYALDPYIIGTIFTGKLVADLIDEIRLPIVRPNKSTEIRRGSLFVKYVIVFITIFVGIWGFTRQIRNIVSKPDTTPQEFAAYLQENITPSAVVESWEWEIDVLAQNIIYHHPTNIWVDRMYLPTQFGIPVEETYDPSPFKPDYLINGPFSEWTFMYDDYLRNGCCTLLKQIGLYELYKVNN